MSRKFEHSTNNYLAARRSSSQYRWLCGLILVLCSMHCWSLGETSWLKPNFRGGNFPLVGEKSQADILISGEEFPGVVRAVKNLQRDVQSVAGRTPALVTGASGDKNYAVIVGTLGQNPLIDQLIDAGELNVDKIRGQWDAYQIQVIDKPLPHLKKALVIVGSNKRGTIYGIYSLSEQIGVSPWYWWADVPIKKHDHLYIDHDLQLVDMPRVKYRGIFLNDEAPALSNWVKEKYGNYNHQFYEKVFELLLRLKANYLWPAMWNNAFADDDKQNMVLADEYGIVMGTSHHEPMMRADKEWNRYGKGPWEYSTNAKNLYDFWLAGAKRNKNYESVYTLGMRGQADTPMSEGENVQLLEKIVHDQREILSKVNDDKKIEDIPQVWALYKEVQGFYERGMRVPDDVTLLWCDDNWGNIRRLPTVNERRRAGGAGIYYHLDYVGGPRSYRWINTVPIAKIQEQMNLAYTYDATKIWIVNVGDLKPMEFPMEFFLRMAWNPEAWPKERIPEFGRAWAEREFGPEHASDIAQLMTDYTRHNSRRKPELQDANTYSLMNYYEADRIGSELQSLVAQADRLYQQTPTDAKDAFFQLLLYPVKASANLTQMYIAQARNQLYANQGRALANRYGKEVRERFAADAALQAQWDKDLAKGKWQHFMDQPRIGYSYWNSPAANTQPLIYDYQPHSQAEMGVALEGMSQAWPSPGNYQLARFDPFGQQARFIDIFNKGSSPFNFVAKTSAPWIIINHTSMQVTDQQRIEVSIDWSQAPKGQASGWVEISGASWGSAKVAVNAFNPTLSFEPLGFVEGDGYIAMHAEHFARSGGNNNFHWEVIPQHGRELSSISVFPISDFSFEDTSKAPYVEYDFALVTPGELHIHSYFAPSLAFFPGRGLRVALAVDDEKPQVLDLAANFSQADWEDAVSNEIRVLTSKHKVERAGNHKLRVYMVDPGVSLEKIVIDTGGLKPSYLGPQESRKM